jgi:RNA polymerase sigma-70 factor (ECF subfamily)
MADVELLRRVVEELPTEYREVIVLRELEGLSYQQIATVTEVPLGTVMSRLSRARKQLQKRLAPCSGSGTGED